MTQPTHRWPTNSQHNCQEFSRVREESSIFNNWFQNNWMTIKPMFDGRFSHISTLYCVCTGPYLSSCNCKIVSSNTTRRELYRHFPCKLCTTFGLSYMELWGEKSCWKGHCYRPMVLILLGYSIMGVELPWTPSWLSLWWSGNVSLERGVWTGMWRIGSIWIEGKREKNKHIIFWVSSKDGTTE